LDEEDFVVAAVHFDEFDFDDVAAAGLDIAADVGGFNGELAVSAVDEDEDLNARGAALVHEGVEGGAGGASGEEDVVYEDDVAAVAREVVAIVGDVYGSGGDVVLFDFRDEGCEAAGEGDSAALDADEGEGCGVAGFLGDFMREADEGALDFRGGENACALVGWGCVGWIGHER
jgi:hypothetical protein